MLFHSPDFLFGFLPVVLAGYYGLSRMGGAPWSILWLLAASLVFYAWWDWRYLAVLLPSILFNFRMGEAMVPAKGRVRKRLLIVGLAGNLAALGFFKYSAFLVVTLNAATGVTYPIPDIGLPLGISFFTFTQIAYLVDVYAGKVRDRDPLSYGLFVTFFPHLIAGPILHHAEMMPQFRHPNAGRWTPDLFREGFLLLLLGLFKKVVLADSLAAGIGPAFDGAPDLSFVEAWFASLGYTFQLYFDFSGYSDMAIALGLMVNIRLPLNFNSPYRALSIQDFWQRWHMTLSRFLRDYLYVPLGGNRQGPARTLANLFVVFLLGGLWHGAGWTFVAWGAMHGAAMVVHRLWQRIGLVLPTFVAWLLTFMFVNGAWVMFRAQNWDAAIKVYKGMLGLSGFKLPSQLLGLVPGLGRVFDGVGVLAWAGGGTVMGLVETALLIMTAMGVASLPGNSQHLVKTRSVVWICAAGFGLVAQAVLFHQAASPFLYFRF